MAPLAAYFEVHTASGCSSSPPIAWSPIPTPTFRAKSGKRACATFGVRCIDPSFENATYLLGRSYLRQGRTKQGQRLISFYAQISSHLQTYVHAEERVRFHRNSPDAHLAVAQLDLLSGYYPKAIVEFKRVLALRPGDAAARAGLRKALAAARVSPDAGSQARR